MRDQRRGGDDQCARARRSSRENAGGSLCRSVWMRSDRPFSSVKIVSTRESKPPAQKEISTTRRRSAVSGGGIVKAGITPRAVNARSSSAAGARPRHAVSTSGRADQSRQSMPRRRSSSSQAPPDGTAVAQQAPGPALGIAGIVEIAESRQRASAACDLRRRGNPLPAAAVASSAVP